MVDGRFKVKFLCVSGVMKLTGIILVLLLLILPLPASATPDASPIGEWQVEDGKAHIRILLCENSLWGFIDWLEDPDTDNNNPDTAKRNRSLLGLPILKSMQLKESRWEGEMYNTDNGRTYNGNIHLTSADALYIEGCVLGGWICGGEQWKRIHTDSSSKGDDALCASAAE